MARHLEDMEAAHDPHSWFESHALFHRALNERSGRVRTNALLENLRGQTERYVRFFQTVEAQRAPLIEEHERIRGAAELRDPDAVARAVEQHLELVRDNVVAHLRSTAAVEDKDGGRARSHGHAARRG